MVWFYLRKMQLIYFCAFVDIKWFPMTLHVTQIVMDHVAGQLHDVCLRLTSKLSWCNTHVTTKQQETNAVLWLAENCDCHISKTARWILLIFGRQIDMAMLPWYAKLCDHRPNIKATGQFLLNTVTTVWFPWKPMALAPAGSRPGRSCRVW